MRWVAAIVALVAVGCGGGRPEAQEPAEPDFDLDLAATPPAPASEPPPAAEPVAAPEDPPPAADAELPWTDEAAARPAAPPPAERPIYRGRAIDLDLKDVELADVFRLLADAGGVSIVVADDVKGKVTLRLRQVPWDQALVTVVKVKRLELAHDGSVYLVRKP